MRRTGAAERRGTGPVFSPEHKYNIPSFEITGAASDDGHGIRHQNRHGAGELKGPRFQGGGRRGRGPHRPTRRRLVAHFADVRRATRRNPATRERPGQPTRSSRKTVWPLALSKLSQGSRVGRVWEEGTGSGIAGRALRGSVGERTVRERRPMRP